MNPQVQVPNIKLLKEKEAVALEATKVAVGKIPVESIKDNNAVKITLAQFDQNTGEPKDPQVHTISKTDMDEARVFLEAQVRSLQEQLANLDEIEKVLVSEVVEK